MDITITYGISEYKIINCNSIYDAINIFENKFFVYNESEKSNYSVFLKNIINLHNQDGIKSVEVIKKMVEKIKQGKNILMSSSLPNVKVFKNKDEFILFDGHHTVLAYMISGKNNLNEIPHLIVQGDFSDNDFKIFFGEHANKIDFWKNYVINWQNPFEKQLCKRVQNNMGEFDLNKFIN